MLDERVRFVAACLEGEFPMSVLCARFGISRKTGYKWLSRYEANRLEGLQDRSRARHTHANATSDAAAAAVIACRTRHDRWGPKKIRQWLIEHDPGRFWPAASTIGDLLKRHGLVGPRVRRHRTPLYTQPFASCTVPNDIWCADFKGWFYTQDGRRCDPFTLADAQSRFLLRCQVVPHPNRRYVQAVCESAFREYGLPRAIRTDNGPPFASPSAGGLSLLSIHWIKLGITPERIAPSHPEQNGRLERLHRTLKEHTANPPQRNARCQQAAFDRFRHEYNGDRPHEALDQRTPASVYRPSLRPYPSRVPEMRYPDGYDVRWVGQNGCIRWRGERIFLSERLRGELVGIGQVDEEFSNIYFGPISLAAWDHRRAKLRWPTKRKAKNSR
ncbi:MAG: IS481 family transposase [Candidatus Zixiibacteriota bacterium]